jgi:hypothetical protein
VAVVRGLELRQMILNLPTTFLTFFYSILMYSDVYYYILISLQSLTYSCPCCGPIAALLSEIDDKVRSTLLCRHAGLLLTRIKEYLENILVLIPHPYFAIRFLFIFTLSVYLLFYQSLFVDMLLYLPQRRSQVYVLILFQ